MEYTHTIVVIDGKEKNPAKLHTQLEPIRLDKDTSMAISSISHGEIYNVYNGNNKIYLNSVTPTASAAAPGGNELPYTKNENKTIMLEIPIGRYNTSSMLLKTVDSVIKERFRRRQDIGLEIDGNPRNASVKVTPANVLIYVTEKLDSPWNLLGISKDIQPNTLIEIGNQDLLSNILPAFLYVNIVENSYINGKLSRNLALVPLSLKGGCSFYEFSRPNYVPIVVKDFSDILLELRTMDGHYVPFNSNCKTVITLNLKPINRTM